MGSGPSGERELRQRFEEAGQGHVFRFWEKLTPFEREGFLRELREIDLAGLSGTFDQALKLQSQTLPPLERPSLVLFHKPGEDEVSSARRRSGEEMLRRGEVGCLLAAGGQSTRLGIQRPKGKLEVLGKTLFQIYADQIRRLSDRLGIAIPFYIMTSRWTHAETAAYFERENYFGLPKEGIRLFEQGSLPTLDAMGKLLLEGPGKLLRNPDGHGGILEAADRQGVFTDAQRRGVKTLFYFQVDNPLVEIADPFFLGVHRERRAEFSLKVVQKESPGEKLGVPFLVKMAATGEDHFRIVEYSDLPQSLQANDFGSVAIHLFEVSWLAEQAGDKESLPWHAARKQVRALDERGQVATRAGVKLERFIFDLLPRARNVALVETAREREFAPIKDKEGRYSLAAAEGALARKLAQKYP